MLARQKVFTLLTGICTLVLCSLPIARAEPRTGSTAALEFAEKVIAGGPKDFMEVRHLTLRGSNFEIGRKLAEIAKAPFVRTHVNRVASIGRAADGG